MYVCLYVCLSHRHTYGCFKRGSFERGCFERDARVEFRGRFSRLVCAADKLTDKQMHSALYFFLPNKVGRA